MQENETKLNLTKKRLSQYNVDYRNYDNTRDILQLYNFPSPKFVDDDDYRIENNEDDTTYNNVNDFLQYKRDSIEFSDINLLVGLKLSTYSENYKIFFTSLTMIISTIRNGTKEELSKFISINFDSLLLPNESQLVKAYDSSSQDHYNFYEFMHYELSFKRNIPIYPPLEVVHFFNDKETIQTLIDECNHSDDSFNIPSTKLDFPHFEGETMTGWTQTWEYIKAKFRHEISNIHQTRTELVFIDVYKTDVEIEFLNKSISRDTILLQHVNDEMEPCSRKQSHIASRTNKTKLLEDVHEWPAITFEEATLPYSDAENPKKHAKCIAKPYMRYFEIHKIYMAYAILPDSNPHSFQHAFSWTETDFETIDNNDIAFTNDADLFCKRLLNQMFSKMKLSPRFKYAFLYFEVHKICNPTNLRQRRIFVKDINLCPIHMPTFSTTLQFNIIEAISKHASSYFQTQHLLKR